MVLRVALLLTLTAFAAGCRAPAAPAAAPEPAPPVVVTEEADPERVTLEARVGQPVRGRVRSRGEETFVELRATEVFPDLPKSAACVRFTMRLCTEEGRTTCREGRSAEGGALEVQEAAPGKALRWSTQWHADPDDPDYPDHWTYWEFDVLAEAVGDDRVRFRLHGLHWLCIK